MAPHCMSLGSTVIWELLLSRPCFLEHTMLGGCRLSLDGLGPQGAEPSATPSLLASILEAPAVTSLQPSCWTGNQVCGSKAPLEQLPIVAEP